MRALHTGVNLLLAVALAAGCAYPRRSTAITPVEGRDLSVADPDALWQLEIVSAVVPPRQRSGMTWDDGGGDADPYVRIYRADELVYESPTLDDTVEPEWNVTLPRNITVPADQEIRIELWDRDEIDSDPVGIWRGNGMPPNALPGAEARVYLEGGASVTLRVTRPRPHRGLGVPLYEVRDDALIVLEVIDQSPAGRADLRPGDRIVAIGESRISDLSEAQAAGALSMALDRRQPLTVQREGAPPRQIELDRGYVWLTM